MTIPPEIRGSGAGLDRSVTSFREVEVVRPEGGRCKSAVAQWLVCQRWKLKLDILGVADEKS